MPFEVFDKRMTPLAKAPSVTIQKRGVISLNKAAHDIIGNAGTVELLYDRDRQVMALRATDDSSPTLTRSAAGQGADPVKRSSRPPRSPRTTASTPPPPGDGSLSWRTACSAWTSPSRAPSSPATEPRPPRPPPPPRNPRTHQIPPSRRMPRRTPSSPVPVGLPLDSLSGSSMGADPSGLISMSLATATVRRSSIGRNHVPSQETLARSEDSP